MHIESEAQRYRERRGAKIYRDVYLQKERKKRYKNREIEGEKEKDVLREREGSGHKCLFWGQTLCAEEIGCKPEGDTEPDSHQKQAGESQDLRER